MSTQSMRRGGRLPDSDLAHPEVVVPGTTSDDVVRLATAGLRLSLGWVMRIAAAVGARRTLGFGGVWESLVTVKRHGWLR
jgi:hypothetical protein